MVAIMGRERDDESGRFIETHTDDVFLEAFDERREMTTQEVADEVGCAYRTAYGKLYGLLDEGLIENRKVGNTILWRRTEGK